MKVSPIAIFFVPFFLTLRLWALPEGTAVAQGDGSFSISGGEMTIQAPDNSIFTHDSFNLGPSETVIFSQPSEQARALNRISSLSPSLIEGSVRANGQVYFLAPGGLIIGEGALIEAGSCMPLRAVSRTKTFRMALTGIPDSPACWKTAEV